MVIGVVVAVVVLAVLFIVPFPLPFSFTVSNPGSVTSSVCYGVAYARGAAVSFSWSTSDGSRVSLSVKDQASNTVYTSTAASGSGSFSADGGNYVYCLYTWSASSVHVQGTASEPLVRP